MKKTLSVCLLATLVALSCVLPIAYATPITGADEDVSVFIGPSQEDLTTEANNANAADVTWPFNSFSTMYVGSNSQFTALYFYVSNPTFGSGTPQITYWNGSSWINLGGTYSPTSGFLNTGIVSYTFTIPEDWVSRTISDYPNYYYVGVSSNGSQGSSVDQVSLLSSLGGGGGGGAPAPEFSTIALMITFVAGGYFVMRKTGVTNQAEL